MLYSILSKAIDTLDAEKGSLMLYDYSQNSLQVRVVYGLQDKKVEEGINNGIIQCSKIKAGEGVAGTVFLERKPIITNLGSSDPRFIVKDILTNTKCSLFQPKSIMIHNNLIKFVNKISFVVRNINNKYLLDLNQSFK